MTVDPATAALLAEMWDRFRPLARSRVDVLDRVASAVDEGHLPDDLRSDGATAAHKLAGSLGTYARPGSHDARRLELLLKGDGDLGEVPPLVAALRRAVEAPPDEAAVHPVE